MGKRIRRGSRFPSSTSFAVLSNSVLLRRIASSKFPSDPSSLDVDTVVQHLRSHYPDYARVKLQPFTFRVQRTLDSLRRCPTAGGAGGVSSSSSSSDDDDDDASGNAPSSRKRPGHSGLSERRLLRAESDHLRRRQLQRQDPSESSDDSTFEAKIEPEFDLTKSLLRESYGNRAKPSGAEEHSMEIEMASEKPRNVVLVDGCGGGSGIETPVVEKRRNGGGEIENEEERKKGPRFRDLGGMKGVIEELMMEVIVPLCHPQLKIDSVD